jgi:hypothetical protein
MFFEYKGLRELGLAMEEIGTLMVELCKVAGSR